MELEDTRSINIEDMEILLSGKNFHDEISYGQKCLLALTAKGKEDGTYPADPVWAHWIFASAINNHFTGSYQFPVRNWNIIYDCEESIPRNTWRNLFNAVRKKDMGKFSSILLYLQTRQIYCPPHDIYYTSFFQQDWGRMYVRWFDGDFMGQVPFKIISFGNERFKDLDPLDQQTVLSISAHIPRIVDELKKFIASTKS